MDPHDPIARHFPLISRFRPACSPLPARVQALTDLANTAAHTGDQGLASAVFNQSALVASDVGLPELAQQMCRQHAAAYLHACPLPALSAVRGLEPVVNLARLRIRAGRFDDGRQLLLDLYNAVSDRTPAAFDSISVPAKVTATDDDRHEVRGWLWRVLLADGTRSLTTQGRWDEALAHIKEHRGVGKRMLDGRQVAVLAALVANDTGRARSLLEDTAPGDDWEQAVSACLAALSCREAGQPITPTADDLANLYIELQTERGMTVFGIRLGLAVLALIESPGHPAAQRVAHELHHRSMKAMDGYAARENLADPLFAAIVSTEQHADCKALLATCGLDSGVLPEKLQDELAAALSISERTIQRSLIRG